MRGPVLGYYFAKNLDLEVSRPHALPWPTDAQSLLHTTRAMIQREPLYGEAAYWEARYDPCDTSVINIGESSSGSPSSHDWYIEYTPDQFSVLRNIVLAHAPVKSFPCVIDVGCGDSSLCREMSRDNYLAVATDLARSAGVAQCGSSFVHCSAGSLPFAQHSFDIAVEKGTIDAMCCSKASGKGRADAVSLLRECARVVRPGGWVFSVSYASPEQRVPLLREGLGGDGGDTARALEVQTLSWRVQCGSRNGFNGKRFHCIYACRLLPDPLLPDPLPGPPPGFQIEGIEGGGEAMDERVEVLAAVQPGRAARSLPISLPRQDDNSSSQRRAVKRGRLMATKKEITRERDAERKIEGQRLLVRAIVAHDEKCVRALLSGGGVSADAPAFDLRGTTACMVAAGVGAVGCLHALSEALAESTDNSKQHLLRATDVLGQTAMHHAAAAGESTTLDALLSAWTRDAGGESLPISAEGAPPLQMAAASASVRCVQMLLTHSGAGAARQADYFGFTPLAAAAFRGNAAVCEELLLWGADAHAVCSSAAHGAQGATVGDSSGECEGAPPVPEKKTCADLAEDGGHHALAKRLRSVPRMPVG